MEGIQHCKQSLCRSLLLQCGALSCVFDLCSSSFTLCFWLISEASFLFCMGQSLCLSQQQTWKQEGAEESMGAISCRNPVSKAEHTNLSAGMPAGFMTTSLYPQEPPPGWSCRNPPARFHSGSAQVDTPSNTHIISWKAGKRKGPEENF